MMGTSSEVIESNFNLIYRSEMAKLSIADKKNTFYHQWDAYLSIQGVEFVDRQNGCNEHTIFGVSTLKYKKVTGKTNMCRNCLIQCLFQI